MSDITMYHWAWYLVGFLVAPRLTFMVLLSLHIPGIPCILMVVGWVFVFIGGIQIKGGKRE